MDNLQLITFLYVSDLKASAGFYGDVLGFQEVLDQGACRIFMINQGAYIGVCQSKELAEQNDDVDRDFILTVVTDEVDAYHQSLSAKGVAAESQPRINENIQIYHFFLRDPDGNLIEIQQFLDPRWGSS